MKSLLAKYAALLAASVCGVLLAPRADSATLSGSVQSSVFELPSSGILGPGDSCSDSQSVAGPSVSILLSCYSAYGFASAGAWVNGEGTDVYGQFQFGLGNTDDVDNDPHHDMNASVSIDLAANGFFSIDAPSPTVDIAFDAVDPLFLLTVNGASVNPSTVESLPTFTPIPYSLDLGFNARNTLAPESTYLGVIVSYDLRDITVWDHASGMPLPNAQISFSATAVPEPGSAVSCCLGIALIALSYRRNRSACRR